MQGSATLLASWGVGSQGAIPLGEGVYTCGAETPLYSLLSGFYFSFGYTFPRILFTVRKICYIFALHK